MKREYIVVDKDGFVSCDKAGEPERFTTFKAATDRARKLAAHDPAYRVRIYELTADVMMPVGQVEVTRAHPLEHYK